MATKVFTTDLKVGMFVADLDRPWVDTPFLLQGFLIEDQEQITALRSHCEFVIVDRARSVGDEYEAPKVAPTSTIPPGGRKPVAGAPAPAGSAPSGPARDAAAPSQAPVEAPKGTPARAGKVLKLEDVARRGRGGPHPTGNGGNGHDDGDGMLGWFKGLFGGKREKLATGSSGFTPPMEAVPETPQEFEARAALLPPGIQVQTYVNQTTVEEEAPRARELVVQAAGLLEKLVADIRLGQSFEVERVEDIVDDMVESIVRNPQALMWVAKLREQDITTYGHGLQVSVYLTSFGRHLGFPRAQLSQLAQVGLLLDIGKIRLPRALLEKQGRLTDPEFEQAKEHVQHGLAILAETPGFDAEILRGIEQHHERMNGTGYPQGLLGEEIGIFGRMSGIVDCFAALTNHRPYAAAVSSYEALRNITAWAGDFFHEPLVQQFVSSVGVFPVGSLIELSGGEVAVVVEHSKVRRLKPRVLVVTGPDKTPVTFPTMVDLLYDPKMGGEQPAFIKRGLAPGAYGLNLSDFYLA
ncbi:MAG TPA: HD-GYP domain-containing protein [Usitatibacter sp.]|jgi:HD-GYP domain-containing protein (c-di-GMP phosphodiesterase class II)|nr:HD-GYP domain-containing protein [Usitatibacter sp.]